MEQTQAPVTTGSSKGRLAFSRPQRKTLLVLCVALLALTAVTTYLIINSKGKDKKSLEKYTYIKPDTNKYTQMTDAQIKTELKTNENIKIDDYLNEPITSSSFKNFSQAYAVALALSGMDKHDKSLEAFRVAEAKAPSDVSYTFYLDYADEALLANNPDLARQIEDKAIQLVSKSTLSEAEKKAVREKISTRQYSRAQ